MGSKYRFTRAGGAWVVTMATADGWRQLDGDVSTHAGGAVACITLYGMDAARTEDVRLAWITWWLRAQHTDDASDASESHQDGDGSKHGTKYHPA